MKSNLSELCSAVGIEWEYRDGASRDIRAPEETCIALLDALGFDIAGPSDIDRHLAQLQKQAKERRVPETIIVNTDTEHHVASAIKETAEWHIRLQDGTELKGVCQGEFLNVPPLPLGIHKLICAGQESTLLSAPETLPVPPRGWGIMAPLYGLGGEPKPGIGDYQDLADLAISTASTGCGFVGINPVHAGFTTDPLAFSPYSPSSRQWLNPLHIAVQKLPQWPALSDTHPFSGNGGALVDYPAVTAEKTKQLKAAFAVYQSGPPAPDFTAFVAQEASSLSDFATHQALSEVYGPYWKDWPTAFQHPASLEVRQFSRENEALIQYHCWLQWVARTQLHAAQTQALAAGMEHGLYLDLAVGTHPYGAETWANERAFSRGVSIGAPSDDFAASGQNWNLTPFNPREMIARNFQQLAQTLRAQLQFCGLLRIDHILGFERSYWIPDGLPGAYVVFPRDALLAVARIEAARANATIIGEDLGNVPDGLRNALNQSGILGCRVAFFERNWKTDKAFVKAVDYSRMALASLTTHDLPTLIGWWKGLDITWRRKLATISEERAEAGLSERMDDRRLFARRIGYTHLTPASNTMSGQEKEKLILAAYGFLAETRSQLAAVQIEDVLALDQQSNLPGTISEHPNWRRRLPGDTSRLAELPMLQRISQVMKLANRSSKNVDCIRRT